MPTSHRQQLVMLWSNEVRDRDGWKCVVCGKYGRGNVQTHHILYRSFFPQLETNINNGITLCIEHHKEIHTLND